MASIGERLAARLAGKTPKNTPMAPEIINVISTENKFMDAGKKNLTIKTITAAKMSPAIPPKTESIRLSVKN